MCNVMRKGAITNLVRGLVLGISIAIAFTRCGALKKSLGRFYVKSKPEHVNT